MRVYLCATPTKSKDGILIMQNNKAHDNTKVMQNNNTQTIAPAKKHLPPAEDPLLLMRTGEEGSNCM